MTVILCAKSDHLEKVYSVFLGSKPSKVKQLLVSMLPICDPNLKTSGFLKRSGHLNQGLKHCLLQLFNKVDTYLPVKLICSYCFLFACFSSLFMLTFKMNFCNVLIIYWVAFAFCFYGLLGAILIFS